MGVAFKKEIMTINLTPPCQADRLAIFWTGGHCIFERLKSDMKSQKANINPIYRDLLVIFSVSVYVLPW
jgi:hypothetical protein